jgi:hypothetical protein
VPEQRGDRVNAHPGHRELHPLVQQPQALLQDRTDQPDQLRDHVGNARQEDRIPPCLLFAGNLTESSYCRRHTINFFIG